jgi:hypothetical protein
MFKKILIGVGAVALLIGAVWASRAWNTLQANARNTKFNADVENLFAALQKYKEKTGTYPVGANAEISKILQGANPKGVTIIIGPKIPANEKGEFVDPWGTPLRIYFSDTGVLIRSAGPNRRFDDSTVIDADDFIRSN